MTIDISNLDSEKQAFLKVNPELLKNLEAEIPKQMSSFQARGKKLGKTKAKWQRDLEDIDRKVEDARLQAEMLRRKYDPELMKIERHFMELVVKAEGALVCPVCGDSDHGNKMNGKAWCMKDNIPLIPKNKIGKWVSFPKIKVASKPRNPTFVGDE